jgi:hypothetical protein
MAGGRSVQDVGQPQVAWVLIAYRQRRAAAAVVRVRLTGRQRVVG